MPQERKEYLDLKEEAKTCAYKIEQDPALREKASQHKYAASIKQDAAQYQSKLAHEKEKERLEFELSK